MRIAIVGAGISGLTTAFYLQKARPDWELYCFDANPRVGGTMHTLERDGFYFEAGGNGFLTNKPDSLQLVEDAGASDLLLRSSDLTRKRYIYTDQIHRLPESPPLFLKSKLLTWPQKLRVAAEVFIPAKRDLQDETLQSFGYRRVGKAMTDVFLDAMTAGIYGTTPDRISVEAAFPLVVKLEREHGGLFRGMMARRKSQAGPGGVLTSFHRGVQTFIDYLYEQIRAHWYLGQPVREIVRDGAAFRVRSDAQEIQVDQVIISSPAYAAAEMLKSLDPTLAEQISHIGYSPIAVVGLGWHELDHPLDGFGLLTTTSAKMPVLGILWESSVFPDRAPEGKKCVRVMIGGQRSPELVNQDESGLLETARRGLELTMGITKTPDVHVVQRWDRGIPCYPVGHLSAMERLFADVGQYPGLHLCNNAYYGVSMNDCARNGRLLAEKITAL